MAIEIFGFLVKPEISIGDIAGIGALIASPLIFWFGYSRARKSEQVKIARELMDRIDVKFQKIEEHKITEVMGRKDLNDIGDLLGEIEYFGYLLEIHEIRDKNILRYCIPTISFALSVIDLHLVGDNAGHDRLLLEIQQSKLNNINGSMKVWLDKYG